MTLQQKIASLIFRVKNSNIKTHIKYLLLIANIIIWATSYVITDKWYNDYLRMAETVGVAQVEASEVKTQPTVKEYVLSEIKKAGLNPNQADKIINCESRWNEDAHKVNWENRGGVDRGLWQISSLHHKEVSNACAYDYKCATNEAIRIYKERGNWDAWACSRIVLK